MSEFNGLGLNLGNLSQENQIVTIVERATRVIAPTSRLAERCVLRSAVRFLRCPFETELAVMLNTVAQIEIDKILVGNA